MNLERVRRASTMAVVASFALVVLAACGEPAGQEAELEDVTRMPTMSDAAAQATREAPPPGATPEDGAATPVTDEATPADGGETAEAMTVEVVSYDIYFEPAELTIPADTDVTFDLPNNGAAPHNFSIDELGIDVDIAPGPDRANGDQRARRRVRVLLQRTRAQRSRHGRHADRVGGGGRRSG